MKKLVILFIIVFLAFEGYSQSVTIDPNSMQAPTIIKNEGIGLSHTSKDGIVQVGTYAFSNHYGQLAYIQTHTNHPLHFITNNGDPQMTLLQN